MFCSHSTFLYHSGMILQPQQLQQVVVTTTGQMPQQQSRQPYQMNKVDYTQEAQPIVSQEPIANQGSGMMYPPQTAIIQRAYPPPNTPPPAYEESSQAVPSPYS